MTSYNLLHLSVFMLMLIGTGCASSQFIAPSTVEDVNQALQGKVASIELTDRHFRRAYEVTLSPDTTRWEGFNDRHVFAIPTSEVQRITVPRGSRAIKILGSTALGLLAGAATSTVTAFILYNDEEGPYVGLAALGIIVIGTGIGGFLGFGYGLAVPIPERAVVYEAPLESYLDQ